MKQVENRQTFVTRLEGRFSTEDILLIGMAYDLAKEAHRPQKRLTGERAFEHARGVALILLDECGVNNPDLIIAALIHDAVEDSSLFGSTFRKEEGVRVPLSYDEWSPIVQFRLERIFNAQVASIVLTVTKSHVDGRQCPDKSAANRFNYSRLERAIDTKEWAVLVLKEGDRLHNLRCVVGTNIVEKTLKETREIHMPIFQRAVEACQTQEVEWMKVLLAKIRQEVAELESHSLNQPPNNTKDWPPTEELARKYPVTPDHIHKLLQKKPKSTT